MKILSFHVIPIVFSFTIKSEEKWGEFSRGILKKAQRKQFFLFLSEKITFLSFKEAGEVGKFQLENVLPHSGFIYSRHTRQKFTVALKKYIFFVKSAAFMRCQVIFNSLFFSFFSLNFYIFLPSEILCLNYCLETL